MVGDRTLQRIDGSGTKTWRGFSFAAGALAVFFAVEAWLFFSRYSLSFASELALYLCLMLLVTLALIPAFPVSWKLVEHRLLRGRIAPVLIACVGAAYGIYAAGCQDFRWPALVRLLALSGLPLLVYAAAPVRNLSTLAWQDAVVWTWLAMAMILRQWKGIWNVPVNLDFMARLFVIAVASWCWVFLRPVPGLGYSFSISARTMRAVALNFVCFAAIAIPLSFEMEFAYWQPRWQGHLAFWTRYVEIFIFIAWLEELLFRGFLQTLLASTLKSTILGQLLASLAFGLSHILLAPAPNWPYVAVASVAGWFYGSAFRQSGSLVGSALTHALVDAVWRTWFWGRG
jgi:membrane protease YdiL (CAAX protease family)